jgi:hypothetical protein
MTAAALNIPERDADRDDASMTKTASSKTAGEDAGQACPECGSQMQVSGSMARCACGYGCASAATLAPVTKVAESPSTTSLKSYYDKIFPTDYVSDLMATSPITPKGGKPVSYGKVPIDKKVSALGARDLRRKAEHPAGQVTVEDPHPESGISSGSGATETPDPKKQSTPSANSVSGLEVKDSIGTGLKDPDAEQAPDLGVPHGASRDGWITREAMATLCPECAVEMAKLGIKRVKASAIAKQLSAAAKAAGFTVRS